LKNLLLFLALAGCASRPLAPDSNEVKLSRDAPTGECTDMGRVTGTSTQRKAASGVLLKDLQNEAAKKGANFVKVEQYSDLGSSVTGTAFLCN
jgi:hypothetical protein